MSEEDIKQYITSEMPVNDAATELVEYATATADPFVPGYEGELNRWLQPPPGEGCGCTVQ